MVVATWQAVRTLGSSGPPSRRRTWCRPKLRRLGAATNIIIIIMVSIINIIIIIISIIIISCLLCY